MSETVKRLDLSANSFEANGRKYLIHDSLTIERFEQYEKLQLQVSWGFEFQLMFKNLETLVKHLDKIEFVKASVLATNMLHGVARGVENRTHPVFLLCALFICREGEDLAKWNNTDALEKIADWRAEGIAVEDFFAYALSFIPSYTTAYKAVSEHILEERKSAPERPT